MDKSDENYNYYCFLTWHCKNTCGHTFLSSKTSFFEMHEEKCKTIFDEEDYSSKNNTKHIFFEILSLHKISVIRDWYLIQNMFGDGDSSFVDVCSCVSSLNSWIFKIQMNKTIISFFLSKCSICEIKQCLSQNVDNRNVTLMSHRWCKMM